MLKLQLLNDSAHYTKLSTLPLSIGRDESNNLVVDEPSVSDFHAEIDGDEGSLTIIDLLSSSGTLVNEHRVVGRCNLMPWDIIRIGTVDLEINDPNTCRPGSWVLRTESDLLSSQFYTLLDKTVVGRDPECDLTIDWQLLSRRHAELIVEGDHLRVVDLDSSNGTYINGKKIEDTAAYPGDEIRFDEQRFIVVAPTRRKTCDANDDDRTVLRGENSDKTQLSGDRNRANAGLIIEPKVPIDTEVSIGTEVSMDPIDPEETLFIPAAEEDEATRLFVPSQHEKQLPSAFLIVNASTEKGRRYGVRGGNFSIGRVEGNDLVLDESGISRQHAQIVLSDGEWHIEDRNSRNGLKVNGEPTANRKLLPGDRITLGNTELLFECNRDGSDALADAETVLVRPAETMNKCSTRRPPLKARGESCRQKIAVYAMPGVIIFIVAAALALGIYSWRSGGF